MSDTKMIDLGTVTRHFTLLQPEFVEMHARPHDASSMWTNLTGPDFGDGRQLQVDASDREPNTVKIAEGDATEFITRLADYRLAKGVGSEQEHYRIHALLKVAAGATDEEF